MRFLNPRGYARFGQLGGPRTPAVTLFTPGAAQASYENRGGLGERNGFITTTGSGFQTGVANQLTDGVQLQATWFNISATAGKYIRMDFGVGARQLVTQVTWWVASQTLGVWQVRGSNDASTWTNISATKDINPTSIAADGGAPIFDCSSNTTGYRYIELTGISGSTQDNYLYEIGLKLVDVGAAARPASTLWTPAEIQTSVWLDAADASTITQSGGLVSQWNDKSTLGTRHATQATSGARPTYNATGWVGNSAKPYISAGSGKSMNFATPILYQSAHGITIMGVYKSVAGNSLLAGAGAGALQLRARLEVMLTKQQVIELGQSSNTVPTGEGHLFGARANSGSRTIYLKDVATVIAGDPGWNGGPSIIFTANGTEYFLSDFAEMFACTGTVSDATIAKAQGALAWKWGIQSTLNAGHAWKSRPPTIAD